MGVLTTPSVTRGFHAICERSQCPQHERYQERFAAEERSPVWFERNFAFRIGARLLRGRVDRLYYVLDDEKVPVQPSDDDVQRIEETATEVAEAIIAQRFDPTPSFKVCSMCDFQLLCPAAER
jgi:DNA helicase II / ATP-dependent DNA helicase PcrA